MKKTLLILIILSFSLPVFCQVMPKDVKEDNPYYEYVQDLVDRGIDVTQGYPDGTFSGDKYTTHYEAAYLMAKLAMSMRTSTSEVYVPDLKDEISWIRKEIKDIKEQPQPKGEIAYSGSMQLTSKFGNIVAYNPRDRAPIGPETNYRLNYSIKKEMGEDASLKMNLDTMDGGFNSSTSRDFALKLLDMEGNLKADLWLENPVRIKAIIGPGSVQHRDTAGVVPSDDYTYFNRPRPSFYLATVMGGYDVTAGYAARAVASSGSVGTNEVNLQITKNLGHVPLFGTVEARSMSRYIFVDFMDSTAGPNSVKEEFSFYAVYNDIFSHKLLLGSANTGNPQSQFYMNYEVYLRNLNQTDVNFIFNSVGRDYRLPFEALEFVPTNLFNKKILDGTIDVGLEIIRPLSRSIVFKSRSDWVGNNLWEMGKNVPGASFTQELSLDFAADRNLGFNAFYRYFYVPSKMNQFSTAVPEQSDILGLGLVYRF